MADRDASHGHVSPILQRLLLYGFAYVQVDPEHSCGALAWRLAGLSFAGQNQKRPWPFFNGLAVNRADEAPLASSSLSVLKRARQLRPNRPLIYCQTPFEQWTPPNRLKRLLAWRRPVTSVLHPEDPFRPLLFMGPVPAGAKRLDAYRRFDEHPYRGLFSQAVARCPTSRFFVREDGSLAEQLDLFAPAPAWRPNADFEKRRDLFAACFRQQIVNIESGAYLFARDRDRLEWFRRDCVRCLSRRTVVWDFPAMPDRDDPLRHLMLVHDPLIRRGRLAPHYPSLHLDGDAQSIRYRQARFPSQATPGWQSLTQARAKASVILDGCAFRFEQLDDDWFSSTGKLHAAVPDQGRIFLEKCLNYCDLAA